MIVHVLEVSEIPQESRIFGRNFINTSPTSIDASSNLPVPNDYFNQHSKMKLE